MPAYPIFHRIFEFDKTLTHSDTSNTRHKSLIYANGITAYAMGKQDALTNLKDDTHLSLKHYDDDFSNLTYISAIATNHDNPEYIAGYIATILKKELTLVSTSQKEGGSNILISEFKVEGSDKPFYIAHADEAGSCKAEDKNEHINLLVKRWRHQNLMERVPQINFYDHSRKSAEAAASLRYITYSFPVMNWDGSRRFTTFNTMIRPILQRTFNEQPLEVQLTQIFKKETILAKKGYTAAALAAKNLHIALCDELDNLYLNGATQLPKFKENCKKAIDNAHIELDQHRGWKQFLGNLCIFILGAGVGFLMKGIVNVVNKRPFLFFANTESAELLNSASECVGNMRANLVAN